jgi:hypothetical protein
MDDTTVTRRRGRRFRNYIPSRWLNVFLDPSVTRDRRIARRWVRRYGGKFQRFHVGRWTLYGVLGDGLAPLYAGWNATRQIHGRKTRATPLRDDVAARYIHRKATK